MRTFNRVLVAMDLSGMDNYLLQMIKLLEPYLDFEKIYFLHIMPDFSVPKNVDVEFHKLFSSEYPVDEKVRDKLALDIQEKIGELPGTDLSVEVREGKPYNKLLHLLEVKEIDLLIVGHKQHSEGSGITARRVARHSNCNILFVPERELKGLRRLLVPVDFSASSARAIRTALDLKQNLPDVAIQCLYVIDMPPSDYYMRPMQNAGFREVLKESAQAAYAKFLQDYDLDGQQLEPIFVENTYSNIAVHINDLAEKNAADLIIMGAQGHSMLESFIFGSVTEKVVDKNANQAILVIR